MNISSEITKKQTTSFLIFICQSNDKMKMRKLQRFRGNLIIILHNILTIHKIIT